MTDTIARSNRADVRNPLLKHPGIVAEWAKLKAEHPPAAVALGNLLKFTAQVCGDEGEKHWSRRKYTSGQYWKVQGVYARHIRNAAALTTTGAPRNHDAREAELWRTQSPAWAASLNRRATVEQWMFDAVSGRRPMPTAEELRQWALKLGTPEDDELRAAVGACACACTQRRRHEHDDSGRPEVAARAELVAGAAA